MLRCDPGAAIPVVKELTIKDGCELQLEVLAADGSGFCRPVYQPEKKQVEFVLQQDADVVEFVSSPIDAIGTLHSMVCISEDGRYVLPPMTTVTVEEVFAPGAWTSAAGAVMECWMISCSVNYSV